MDKVGESSLKNWTEKWYENRLLITVVHFILSGSAFNMINIMLQILSLKSLATIHYSAMYHFPIPSVFTIFYTCKFFQCYVKHRHQFPLSFFLNAYVQQATDGPGVEI